MKNVLKYPGSKSRIAKWIVSFIPEHDVYLEPFFGGGAVFFNKKPSRIETINDLSAEVYNYFKVLRDSPEKLIRFLALTPYGRIEYEKSFEAIEDEIERARRFAVRCCQGFGCSNKYKNGFRSSVGSKSPRTTSFWNDFPEVLQLASKRLLQAQIENQDAINLIERYNQEEVFIYADPPYPLSTRKNYLYEHEMNNEEQKS
ncbi:MAG: DNA adenine methylase [Tissierellia bacterium]|nr:DNA adenine methylase [Tissierellia bacterium]